MAKRLPSLVIVGRPNVGKSTLFNRLTGKRRSIVTNEPGITRDRIYGTVEWRGRALEIVDTGGIEFPRDRRAVGLDDQAMIPREILRQARVAIENASLLVLVTDSQAGLTPLDEELARLLHETGKTFVVAANKVDSPQQEIQAAQFHALGAPVFPISAERGSAVDELLDYALEKVADAGYAAEEASDEAIEVAIVGRPNVGKSTLLNLFAGEERAIVSPEPGTTRDTVDTEVWHDGRLFRFVDTAGIRKKGKTKLIAEKLSVVMARKSLERASVALLVVDSVQGITQGDATIASYAERAGCAVIVVMNKWDLAVEAARAAAQESARAANASRKGPVEEEQSPAGFDEGKLLPDYEKLVRKKLKFLSYAPVVFLSAKTGERADRLYPLMEKAAEAHQRRIPTPELNRWLEHLDLQRGTTPKARPVKIYYVTQASARPPRFLLFTNQRQRLHFSYERFLENALRAKFDFTGTPIRFVQRLRKRGHKSTQQR